MTKRVRPNLRPIVSASGTTQPILSINTVLRFSLSRRTSTPARSRAFFKNIADANAWTVSCFSVSAASHWCYLNLLAISPWNASIRGSAYHQRFGLEVPRYARRCYRNDNDRLPLCRVVDRMSCLGVLARDVEVYASYEPTCDYRGRPAKGS